MAQLKPDQKKIFVSLVGPIVVHGKEWDFASLYQQHPKQPQKCPYSIK